MPVRCEACPIDPSRPCWAASLASDHVCGLVRDDPQYRALNADRSSPLTGPPDDPFRAPRRQGLEAAPHHVDTPRLDPWLYITEAQLVADTRALVPRLPEDVDLVVAIARSGLLPGSLIAYHLHVPLAVVSRQAGVNVPGHGVRLDGRPGGTPRRILLVDDTVASGGEMRACGPIVEAAWPGVPVTRAAIYCQPRGSGAVDLCAAVYPGSHFLEWNWPNAGHGALCAYDFDGILCPDFTPEQTADEASYRAAMAAMPPRFLPRRLPVPLVVTGRPESTRELTEAWLDRWGVRVERLVMWAGDPHPPADQVAPWKAEHYADSACTLFAESDPAQAEIINRLTGRPVLCPALGRVLPPRSVRPAPDPAAVEKARRGAEAARAVHGCTRRGTPDGSCGCKAPCGRLGGRVMNLNECLAERLAGHCP